MSEKNRVAYGYCCPPCPCNGSTNQAMSPNIYHDVLCRQKQHSHELLISNVHSQINDILL